MIGEDGQARGGAADQVFYTGVGGIITSELPSREAWFSPPGRGAP